MMPDDFYKKNMEMWEQYTSSYMDTMFKTVEKTLEQSKMFKDAVDKSVASAMETQVEATKAALDSIEKQMEDLTSKVDELITKQQAE
jgi:hypothetical protein